jgi:hypothetical protein
LQMKFPLENKLFYLDGNTWRIIKWINGIDF